MALNRRQRRRETRRREMLDAAMEIIIEEGLDALTIARLANSLDAAVGALYRYFPGKQGLLTALQKRALGALHQQMLAELDVLTEYEKEASLSHQDAILLRMVALFSAYLRDEARDPARHRLIDRMLSSPVPVITDEQARQVNEVLAPIVMTCAQCINHAVELELLEPGDPIVRFHLVWAAIHGLDHFRTRDRIQPAKLHVSALLPATLETMLRGWGAPADAVQCALGHLSTVHPQLMSATPPNDTEEEEED